MASCVVILHILFSALIGRCVAKACDPIMQGRCICDDVLYDGVRQFVVNCTDSGFNDTLPLRHLPANTEVLIFTGNNITELPWNVFGTLQNYSKLQIVDMSNNRIHEILGKSYHRVPYVRRLVLNHNHISIADDEHHPRIFSNFINLEELHLTNAFEDNADNLGIDLHDIFVNSNLTKLIKLHLEQNEVTRFKDREVFCDLPSLMDLHLGDNHLQNMDFRIDCLHHLRFIDLEGNKITKLTKSEMAALDALPLRNQSLEVDITDNPYSCECGIKELFEWLHTTKVVIRKSERLRCIHPDGEMYPKRSSHLECRDDQIHVLTAEPPQVMPGIIVLLCLLSVVLVSLIAAVIYSNRKRIQTRISPLVDSVSRKVYYSSIGHNDEQEVVDL